MQLRTQIEWERVGEAYERDGTHKKTNLWQKRGKAAPENFFHADEKRFVRA